MAEVRDYELSLWTLQDSFLTVLKPYGIGVKNQVQEGKLNIKDDGNETLSFSIPMYLYSKTGDITTRKENPIWCNVINGTLIADLRKVKLIFDKHGAHEKVFEFVILKVTERHESDQLFCDVECEGLAFHELGKIGYKIVLSSDEFELDHKNWEESDQSEAEPVATIQYWNDKIFSDRKDWTYEVVMDQHEEVGRADLAIDKIYEDRYVASWEVVNDQLQPTRWEIGKEKARTTFEIKESNIFNATQEIAEAFGVFCRYEYEYDDNYHITGRKVVYYNNFLNEEIGAIDLTYPYNTNNITREMDSTDLVTKMYIQSVDDDLTDEGTVSITSVEANKMKEDYLLNFDYLYKIGSISNEQYEAISEFEVEIRKLNDQFEKYSSIYNNRGNQLINLEAEIQHLKDSITEDREEIVNVNDIIRAFGLSDGDDNAKTVVIRPPNGNAMRDVFKSKKKSSTFAVSLPAEYSKGIAKDSDIKAYAVYSITEDKLKNKISAIKVDRNEKTGEVKEIYNIPKKMKIGGVNTEIKKVYLYYKCNPSLQYAEVKQKYETKLAKDISRLNALEKRKVKVKSIYDNAESKINEITEKKKELILRFEEMMGPALREGYWNPESYNEYGNKYSGTISLMRETNNMHSTKDLGMRAQNFPLTDTGTYLDFVWDNGKDSDGEEIDTWMDEQKSYYESGVDQEKIYYPCMRITGSVLEELNKVFNPAPNPSDTDYEYWKKYEHKNFDDLEMYSLMFYIGTETQNQQILEDVDGWVSLAIGSECHFAFRKGYLKGDTSKPYIFPVFVLTGLDSFSDDTVNMILTKTCKLARVVTWTKPDEEDEGAPSEDPEQTMLDMDEIVINNNLEMYWWVDSKASDENTWYNGSTKLLTKTSGGFTPVKDYYPIQPYDLYYPRILIKTWKLKKSQDGELADLTIKCGNAIDGIAVSGKNLKDFEDFSIIAITSEMQSDEDYVPDLLEAITIKPASLLKYGCWTREQGDKNIFAPYPVFSIDYSVSNADTAIYLDAIQVMKENSQPKVSYTIDLNNTRKELIENAYNLLGTIAHINDADLKFRNIQGYVSEVDMDLDHPWEDSITIQNYKNKFEDLFSKIVAETAAMQKNSYTVGFAANALTASGGITQDVMQYTILNTDLNYAFNNGKLTIDEVNGIMGESEAGVVAYRGGGIFTANEKDENGDWVWNTGILPTGINANLITAGRIDTNQVNIYAGSDLRFMWNGEGLFAYKWNTLEAELASLNGTSIPDDFVPKIDDKQYVRYNGEGLFLIAEQGTEYLSPTWQDESLSIYIRIKPTRCRFINNNIILVDPNDEGWEQTTGTVIGSYSLFSGYSFYNVSYLDFSTGYFKDMNDINIGTFSFTIYNPFNSSDVIYNSISPIGEYSYDEINNIYIINYLYSTNTDTYYYNIPIPNECLEDDWIVGQNTNHTSDQIINNDNYNYKIEYIIDGDTFYFDETSCGIGFFHGGAGIRIIISLPEQKKYYIQTQNNSTLIKRVEVSWDGFLLRNWNNEVVFHADPTSGNLYAQFEEIFISKKEVNFEAELFPESKIGFKFLKSYGILTPALYGKNSIISLEGKSKDNNNNETEFRLEINSSPFLVNGDFWCAGLINYASEHIYNNEYTFLNITAGSLYGIQVDTSSYISLETIALTSTSNPKIELIVKKKDSEDDTIDGGHIFLNKTTAQIGVNWEEGNGAYVVTTTNTFGLYTAGTTSNNARIVTSRSIGSSRSYSHITLNAFDTDDSEETITIDTTRGGRVFIHAKGGIYLRSDEGSVRVRNSTDSAYHTI